MRNKASRRWTLYSLAALLCLATPAMATPFVINVNFLGGLTPTQQGFFTNAANTWMSLLPAYQPGISIASLNISARGVAIDGVGGVLGSAGPNSIVNQGLYSLATTGSMQFDSADLANLETNGTLGQVILHEMAHAMGFGTLWTDNSVYIDGSGQYTGTNALAAYRTEFSQAAAVFIPVELSGGGGTADGHWDEVDGGSGNTGRVSSFGDMRFELMTGWLNSPTYISQTTLQSFVDIGFVTAIPEPATLFSVASGALILVFFKRYR